MRCPVCRRLLWSGNICYHCGYGRKPKQEVKVMAFDEDEYQDRLDALNNLIDEELDEPAEDEPAEDEFAEDEPAEEDDEE